VRIIKWSLLGVVLWFVGRSLVRNWQQVDFAAVRIAWPALVGSVIAITAIYLMQMLSYRFLLASYARKLPWRVMMAVAWVPILGKYVPGKVAAIAGAVLLLRRFGVGARWRCRWCWCSTGWPCSRG
jgi:glycosyltransferase 2 family protein